MLRAVKVAALAMTVVACAADPAPQLPPPNYGYGSSLPPRHRAKTIPQPPIHPAELLEPLNDLNRRVRRMRDKLGAE